MWVIACQALEEKIVAVLTRRTDIEEDSSTDRAHADQGPVTSVFIFECLVVHHVGFVLYVRKVMLLFLFALLTGFP